VTNLATLGWTPDRGGELPAGTVAGRVARVDRGRLTVLTGDGETRVHLAGGLRGDTGLGFPAVGDWVAVRGELAVAVLPRRSAFTRTGAGRASTAQVLATNVDTVLVVDALTGAPRLRRVERYLAVAWSSGATPAVVLTKADLCADVPAAVRQVADDAPGVAVLAVSAVTGAGLDALRAHLGPGRTAAMVGPSGVGKSSLANALAGRPVAAAREIRADGRGRHTTTHRELHLLPGGGLLIDTPGLRELALYDDGEGVATAYADVTGLAAGCRFRLRAQHRARLRRGRGDRRRPARPRTAGRLAEAPGRGAPAAAARRRPGPRRRAGAHAGVLPVPPRPAEPGALSPR
jgi:ribosome small subunit-dependent GTPase A